MSERLHSIEGRAHSEIEALEMEIHQSKEIIHELRHGDHDMSERLHSVEGFRKVGI